MTKLEAVNLILRALSEHTVASVDTRHPSVVMALAKLDIARQEVLSEGWWFNNIDITLNYEIDGRIAYPTDMLAFVPNKYECIVRSGYLYNTRTQSFVFTENVAGLATYDLSWEDLPNAAQRLVAYQAAISAYADDMGDKAPDSITAGYGLAQVQLSAGHMRQRRYNARSRRQWFRYESARRG